MDYSNLTTVELTAVSTTLDNVRIALRSDSINLPDGFQDMLLEFLAMDQEEQDDLLSKIGASANLRAYVESVDDKGDLMAAIREMAQTGL